MPRFSVISRSGLVLAIGKRRGTVARATEDIRNASGPHRDLLGPAHDHILVAGHERLGHHPNHGQAGITPGAAFRDNHICHDLVDPVFGSRGCLLGSFILGVPFRLGADQARPQLAKGGIHAAEERLGAFLGDILVGIEVDAGPAAFGLRLSQSGFLGQANAHRPVRATIKEGNKILRHVGFPSAVQARPSAEPMSYIYDMSHIYDKQKSADQDAQ